MVSSYLSPAAAKRAQAAFRRLEKTIEEVFWDVTWTAFVVDRPADRDAYGQDIWRETGTGEGRLRDTGVVEPSSNEGILLPNSPYQMSCLADSELSSDHYIVVVGTKSPTDRFFKIEAFKPREGERTHATAYLREIFHADSLPVDGAVVNGGF